MTQSTDTRSNLSPTLRQSWVLVSCAAATALVVLACIPTRIAQGGYLNYVSGTWAALADDAVHGVLYRPLVSDLGYGGTRYFPLHIVLHALLVKLGLSLRPAGHLLSICATVLLVAGGALGLSRRGAPKALAWSGGLLAIASRTAFMGAAGIRGDILPLAIGVLGLGLTPRDDDDSALPAGLCFALAVLAKPTLAWAAVGAFVALIVDGKRRSAVMLTLYSALAAGIGFAGAYWWSHGEMLRSFQAVAGGGGFSLQQLRQHLAFWRPGDLGWILGGVGLTLFRGRRALTDPLCAAGLVCLPVIVLLFCGGGIHVNHLIDPTSIGALAIAAAVLDPKLSSRPQIVLAIATVLGLAEALFFDGMLVKRGDLERTMSVIPAGPDPILSEQPWVPLIGGERAYVLDAFSLLQTRESSPEVDHDFLARLDRCGFRAVVLLGRFKDSEFWYDKAQFGAPFRHLLLERYSLAGVAGGHVVYFPRCGVTTPPRTFDLGETETFTDRTWHPGRFGAFIRSLRH